MSEDHTSSTGRGEAGGMANGKQEAGARGVGGMERRAKETGLMGAGAMESNGMKTDATGAAGAGRDEDRGNFRGRGAGSRGRGADSREGGNWLLRYFFAEGATTRLAVMRVLCTGLGLAFFMDPLADHLALLRSPAFDKPQWVLWPLIALFGEEALRRPGVIYGLFYATAAFGVTGLIGLFSRLSVTLYGVGFLLLVAHGYSYDEIHHTPTLYVIFLILLGSSPCGDCLSVDAWLRRRKGGEGERVRGWKEGQWSRLAVWPLRTVQCLLAMAYLDAACSKLIIGGPHWFNGYTMQQYLLTDGISRDIPLGVWLAGFREVGIVMAVFAVAFEGLFWLVLLPWFRRWAAVFVVAGLSLHLGIYMLQKAPFFMWMVLYATWVPWERLPGLRTRGERPGADGAAGGEGESVQGVAGAKAAATGPAAG